MEGGRHQERKFSLKEKIASLRDVAFSGNQCYRCGEEGHWEKECPLGWERSSREDEGPPHTSVPASSDDMKIPDAPMEHGSPAQKVAFSRGSYFYGNKCIRCGEDGHWQTECPLRWERLSCDNCGAVGHSKYACPNH